MKFEVHDEVTTEVCKICGGGGKLPHPLMVKACQRLGIPEPELAWEDKNYFNLKMAKETIDRTAAMHRSSAELQQWYRRTAEKNRRLAEGYGMNPRTMVARLPSFFPSWAKK